MKIEKSEVEWKNKLTPEEYHVLREKGTEPPFTGKFYENKNLGVYYCKGCNNKLFESDKKYDSRSGWPSFFDVEKDAVELKPDHSMGMNRIEVMCRRCGSHLGHVFSNSPTVTGQRYCINSASLGFKSNKK